MRILIRLGAHPGASGKRIQNQIARGFYSGECDKKMKMIKLSGFHYNRPRGRDSASLDFESRIHVLGVNESGGLSEMYAGLGPSICVVEPVTLDQVREPIQHPHYLAPYTQFQVRQYPPDVRQHIRANGDSWASRYGPQNEYNVITVVDPVLLHRTFRPEEASVELITAFRNVLYDWWELKTAKTLRIPALGLYRSHPDLMPAMPKLNQASLIKGFHRCPTPVKDWLAMNKDLRVELFVPRAFFPAFAKVFLEEPWEAPTSIWSPGPRGGKLYQDLPIPQQLLENEGYHGHREEILNANETEGVSLLAATNSDGTPAEKCDALVEAPASSVLAYLKNRRTKTQRTGDKAAAATDPQNGKPSADAAAADSQG